jgi:hypothetical protein
VVFLQDENTWTFVILWIIFNNDSMSNPCHDICDEDIILG